MLNMPAMPKFDRYLLRRALPHVVFFVVYLFLDAVSYIQPLHGLDITPWNPQPGLGFVYWLRYGEIVALPWFCGLFIAEGVVRGFPAGWVLSIVLSLGLVLGYGCIANVLRRYFTLGGVLANRRDLLVWLSIIAVGTLLNAALYLSLLYFATNLITLDEWATGVFRYWIGDLVGITVSMPIIWIMATNRGRMSVRAIIDSRETVAYCCATVLLVWFIFIFSTTAHFDHFYFLFIPVVWAAARHGLAGAALVAVVLQLAVIVAVTGPSANGVPLFELQLLLAILALVCFFIGVVVDEQKQIAAELKRSLSLSAAAQMAGALAHELNQPVTAIFAYGKSCEQLLARNETGYLLKDTIGKLINESNRAASVVRRLRDFFRTGATQMEPVDVALMIDTVTALFAERMQQHGITLHDNQRTEMTIKADRLQIEMVLRNLLDNAVDAVLSQPKDKRDIRLEADILDGGRLCVSIIDSGPGVSENMLPSLFEPFVSSKSSGMGLGLVLSRTIIEAHGGNLWAEVADHGIFKFVLPLAGATV